jgi:hypothetical protein
MRIKMVATRRTNKTVLIVGEGDTEKAFLDHLKSLYVARDSGVSVKVLNAHGGSPQNIVEFAIRQITQADYQLVAVLMDTDVPWPQQTRVMATRKKIILVGAHPCCDGLLLQISGQPVPDQSDRCKMALAKLMGGKPTSPELLARQFPKDLLDQQGSQIVVLGSLLTILAGNRPKNS